MLLLKSAIPFIIHFFEIFLIVGSGVCAGEGLVYIFIMQKRSSISRQEEDRISK